MTTAWLRNSLIHRANEMHRCAQRARHAYKTDPMRSMAEELAEAYVEAAAVFERALLKAVAAEDGHPSELAP